MRIEICSLGRAIELAASAEEETAVISIVSTDEKDVEFTANPHVGAILHLKFNDLSAEYDEEGIPYGEPVPVREDFAGLKSFVDALCCGQLIVHCREGASRSAAVAAAVWEYRGGRDELRKGQDFRPNPLVYTLASRELGCLYKVPAL